MRISCAISRRHLEKRPVEARPRTWSYRAERFVARNRLGVALAAPSLLIVAAAGIALTVQIQHPRAQALRNQRPADFLTQVMGLRYDIASGPMRSEGRAAHMVDAIRYASRSLSAQMADQPELEARLRGEIGHALAELGYYEEAEDNLTRPPTPAALPSAGVGVGNQRLPGA
jgi:eukaryotic-like serine/threonine-protein kinase